MDNRQIDWDSLEEASDNWLNSIRESRIARNRRFVATQVALATAGLIAVGVIAHILNESEIAHRSNPKD